MLPAFSRRCLPPWPQTGPTLNATPRPLAEMASNELEPAFWALAEQGLAMP